MFVTYGRHSYHVVKYFKARGLFSILCNMIISYTSPLVRVTPPTPTKISAPMFATGSNSIVIVSEQHHKLQSAEPKAVALPNLLAMPSSQRRNSTLQKELQLLQQAQKFV
ncbi:hypothetical protein SLA2020_251710 [Shorea laevis]